ncbi:MAG: hypothetical protein EA374_05305 [Acholeplasmatales bacterium]|nr:MAG: hypothetical protein EA374_05305 [Acholeplasmatales bacterium]
MKQKTAKQAFVTFVMRNDAFIPGALVFAYALRRQESRADLVCLIDEHVTAAGQAALAVLYDRVIRIDSVYVPHGKRHERQDRPFLFTRFQALRLGRDGDLQCGYEKIVIADADLLPLREYDTLFTAPAPAGVINEDKNYCMESEAGQYIIPDSVFEDGSWRWHKVYADLPFGAPVPKEITDRVLTDHDNMGVNAALYVIKPSMGLYRAIEADLDDPFMREKIAAWPWPEMQYITAKLSGSWHNLDLRYSSFNGYPVLDVLNGIHYAGLKPWAIKHRSVSHYAKKTDYRLWYRVFATMLLQYPAVGSHPKVRDVKRFVDTLAERIEALYTPPSTGAFDHLF